MEDIHRSEAILNKLEGAIAKKKRRRTSSAANRSAAEPVVVRGNKIQPLIIHAVSPPLIHAQPSTFMRIVQTLTGCPATRLRCKDIEAAVSEAERTGTGSPLSSLGAAPPVGSPCSSMSSASNTITATTDYTISITSSDEENLDANAGPSHKILLENVECRNYTQEPGMASPSINSCNLLGHSDEANVFFVDSVSAASVSSPHSEFGEEHLCFAEPSDNVLQDLESTLDSYLEHLLSSYDRDAYARFTSTSALLADVCDPMLLKELS